MNALRLVKVSSNVVINQNERVGKWMFERGSSAYHSGVQCIGYEKHGELVAGVMYESFNKASLWMHVAATGKFWLTREYLRVCFDFPFNQLKAKVLVGLVPSTNTEAIKFDEHLGFKLLSVLKDGHPHGDLLIYEMRREDCRWLRI